VGMAHCEAPGYSGPSWKLVTAKNENMQCGAAVVGVSASGWDADSEEWA
jgi:hypothetical protein